MEPDRYSFEPILIAAGLIPPAAAVDALAIVRNNRATREGVIKPI
jgi:hypothetical protein